MWAAILNDENEFQSVVSHLSKTLSLNFEQIETATGALVAHTPNNSSLPCFGFASDPQDHSSHLLIWLHHNRHPRIFVSTGLIRSCGLSFLDSPFVAADLCVRTAGRVDFGGVPILFEEFQFDPMTQAQIKSIAGLPSDSSQKIFGPSKDVSLPENREWIFKHFGTVATDAHIGDFVRSVKSLGSLPACLKVFSETNNPIGTLCSAWEKIFLKMQSDS